MIETRKKGTCERGLILRDFEGSHPSVRIGVSKTEKSSSLTLLCREKLLKDKNKRFKGGKVRNEVLSSYQVQQREKERFPSAGDRPRVLEQRDSLASLPGKGSTDLYTKDEKTIQMTQKIRVQAERILSLETVSNRQTVVNCREHHELVLQLTLLTQENSLLKQKIAVLEGGLHTLRRAADHETFRAEKLESQLSLLRNSVGQSIFGTSDGFKSFEGGQTPIQPLGSETGGSQRLIEELIQYKIKADEKIFQTTLEVEKLKNEVGKLNVEVETLERKLESSLKRTLVFDEKYKVIFNSFQGVRDLAHTAVDAMNAIAKEISE